MESKIDKKCDTCISYEWYYDKCNKFNCEVDDRSCCSFWKSKEGSKCQKEEDQK